MKRCQCHNIFSFLNICVNLLLIMNEMKITPDLKKGQIMCMIKMILRNEKVII